MNQGNYTRRLHLGEQGPFKTLLVRAAMVTGIMLLAWLLLWLIRDGLNDNRGLPMGPLDVLYFAVVTVTTLGYGDIVPVSPEARAMVTFGITPLRVLTWLVFLSTAYELVLRKSIERIEMESFKKKLKDHVIICGFGVKGRSAVKELVKRGFPLKQIVVIDASEKVIEEASRLGVNFLLGTASSEQVLLDAVIERAAQAIVVPNDDEACVLICLTIKELAPQVKIRAAAREEENIKLIRRSGADTVIAPSVSSGRLLASATSAPWSTDIVEELFEHGRGAEVYDLTVDDDMAGRLPKDVLDGDTQLLLEVHSKKGDVFSFAAAGRRLLAKGDVMVVYSPHPPED